MKKNLLFSSWLILFAVVFSLNVINAQVSITAFNTAYTENFNTLANTGITNSTFPPGWTLTETGGGARDNEQYAADDGSSTTGDTYSYGTTSSTERAFGGLQSGTLIPVIGASYTNNTGATIVSLNIAYIGEEWRLGTAARTDRMDFQYSLNATSLTTGTWVDVDPLDFTTPNTVTIGAKDGNAAANQTAISSSILSLSIPNGATFWIRWNDFNATGADDGLAVDGFSLTAPCAPPTTSPINGPVSVCAGTNGVPYFVNNTPGSTYVWTVAGGTQASGTNTNSITVNWGAAGPGNVGVVETNSCGAVGTPVNLPVTINPLPTVTGPPDFQLCANDPDFDLINVNHTPPGGTFSGPFVTGTLFSPSMAGAGMYNLLYSYTDMNGCSGSDPFIITVNTPPIVTCPANISVCINSAPFALTGGSPAGGTYSGPGVSMGMFNPGVAGLGMKTITYSYADGNGCTNTCTFIITVNPQPIVICPSPLSVCFNTPPFALMGATPAGGIYSGPGVAAGMFSPAVAGTGMHTITYLYTDPVTMCANACTFTITVNALPVVSCPSSFSVCINLPAFALTGATPAGGTYSGTGVSMGTFNPVVAGPGMHTITYSYTDPNPPNCNNTCSFTITVNALPTVNCPASSSVPINTPPYTLTGGSPAGGTYTGAGVSMNTFNPNTAGLGPHTITYTYNDPLTMCSNSCMFTITVAPIGSCTSGMEWVYMPPGFQSGSCTSGTNCCTNTICYGLQYTPEHTGILNDYTTGFFVPCLSGNTPVVSNMSCVMNDNSFEINGCGPPDNLILFNSSGNQGVLPVTACVPVILHQVCFTVPIGTSFQILEDTITDLSTSIEIDPDNHIFEFPEYTVTTVSRIPPVPPTDQASTVSCPALAVAPGYPVVLDQCGSTVPAVLFSVVDNPDPLTCEGTRVFTYKYTACPGYMFFWHYTYTIERNDFMVPPDGNGTVSCPSQAVSGNVMLPTVISDCGEPLTPTGPVQNFFGTDTYNGCEGTISFTWTYTDCEGNSHKWTYTFLVDYSGGLTPPTSTTMTVSCPAQAADPGTPPSITDACGRTVNALFVAEEQTPSPVSCNGTIVWRYRYTACDNVTTADWTKTYSVIYSGGLTPPPSTTMTVSCPAQASNPGAPPSITDACGRTVNALFVAEEQNPNPVSCNGTIVWRYRYTACDGVTTADWTKTYSVIYSGGLMPPPSTTMTVSCPAQATDPGTPPAITDACGRTVNALFVAEEQDPAPVSCNGTIVWRYRYTACDNVTTADWTKTYSVIYSGGLTPPPSTTMTVSCPAQATDPGTPPAITDACGRTVNALFVAEEQDPAPVTCNGTIVWRYRYTACDGVTTADWTKTYTVIYSGGLNPPPSQTMTVSCPAQATDPGTPPAITDACGRTVNALFIAKEQTPNPVDCNGTIVYRYRYTACDGVTTADWTKTYNVIYSGGLMPPPSTTMTVSCPAQATDPGTPPAITDACGRTVNALFIAKEQTPNPVDCNGTIVYRYRYTACDGVTTADWTKTYNVIYSGGLMPPPSTTMTVSCPAQATDPGTPPAITDACGRTVNALFIAKEQTPNPVDCNGTVVYRYRYTACDGVTTADWTKTYSVIYSGELTPPPSTTMTVSCPAQATDPGTPPAITDACGRTVNALFVAEEQDPAPVSCNGTIVWRYRYTACDNVTTADWTKTYSVIYSGGLTPPPSTTMTVSCPAQASDPGAPPSITDACGRTVNALFVAEEQNPNPVSCNGTIVWRYRYTACDNVTTADWTKTYSVIYSGGLTPPPSTTMTVSCPAQASDPGAPPSITDACGRTVNALFVAEEQTPSPVSCNGTIIWRYRYTACDNVTTADWTKTYSVIYSGGLTPPPSTTMTVSCPAQASDPGAPPSITDACGRTVNALFVAEEQNPNPVSCNGTIVWRYRYTACDNVTTADWTKTYSVIYSGGLTPPPSTTMTVSCPAQASDPGTPPSITDACGRTVNALFVAEEQTPAPVSCNGTIIWRYRYTACDGVTTADWTKTYSVIYSGGLTPPPSTTMTVSCPAQATDPGTPPAITDACGRTVNALFVAEEQTPAPVSCNGTIVWRYRYTDCDNVTTADWTKTYSVIYSGGLTPPPSTTMTVSCPAQASNPGAPPSITDACGRTVNALFVAEEQDPAPVSCNGTIVWRYRYTACDNVTTADWTKTYTVIYSGGLTPPPSTTMTVSCPAQASDPGAPPSITDACGRTVNALFVAEEQTPSPVSCNGTIIWRYRYTACDNVTTADWTKTYSVIYSGGLTPPPSTTMTVSCPAQASDPGTPPSITDACGRTVNALFVAEEQNPNPVSCNGTIVWRYRYTACDNVTTADWTKTYSVIYSGGLTPPPSTTATVSCPSQASDPGTPPSITDACGRTVNAVFIAEEQTPNPVTCNGIIVWRYRYTACDNVTTTDWTKTYSVIYSGGLTPPANGASTVSCPVQAVNPGPPASITDACGRTVNAVLVGSSTPPVCEGAVVWTYRYTACDNTTTADWTYTYTIDYSGGLLPPVNASSTVACPAQAVNPGSPANILDACGRTVVPVLIGSVSTPPMFTCEGAVVWTYRYTACDMTTTADWTYTYTVEREDFTVPANGGSEVTCATEIVWQEILLPTVTSNCQEVLTPVGPVLNQFATDTYNGCEGTISYTWKYTDCEGNFHYWTYTYDVQHTTPAEQDGPVPTSTTINCYLLAAPPVELPMIIDACGNILQPTGPVVGGTNTGNCGGTITYTYTYTDCAGLQYPWVYTNNIVCDPLILHVWLEGPYSLSGDSMSTKMNQLHTLPGQNAPPFYIDYPAGQPYSGAPWNYSGNPGTQWGDFMGQTPYPADVVDWVLVMIRKNGLLPINTIWTCAGWVHKDGLVTFPENCPLPAFSTSNLYYFVVQHRNHLGILSPTDTDMPCGTAQLEWDFRNSNSYQPVFRFGQKQVEPGVWAMFAANGEQIVSIQAINSQDRTLWRTLQGTFGYTLGDFELDADTDSADENVWKNNQNRTTGVVFY